MRICVIANSCAVHTQRWAQSFAEAGNDVSVLSIRKSTIPGVSVHTVCVGPENSASAFWTLLSYLRLLLRAKRELRQINPDVVNACYAPTHGVIAGFAGCHPLVLSIWGSDVISHTNPKKPWWICKAIGYALRKADLVCVTSRFLLNEITTYGDVPMEVVQIPYGVDCERFSPHDDCREPQTTSHFCIGFVKTLAPIYGPDVLLRAMALVVKRMPTARLVMVGRNRMGGQLARLAKELGIENNVEFLGYVPNDDIPALLRSLDVMVNPSVCRESFGVSVLEASACGVAVVATRVGGVPEVCIDERTGLLVEPSEPEALGKAILYLAENPEFRQRMGREGRQFVLDHYVWKDNVEAMLNRFEALLDRDSVQNVAEM